MAPVARGRSFVSSYHMESHLHPTSITEEAIPLYAENWSTSTREMNFPRDSNRAPTHPLAELPEHLTAPEGEVSLLADFDHTPANGYIPLYLVNLSGRDITVHTQDGNFYAKLEAHPDDGNSEGWTRAQQHCDSWCGNSFYSWKVKTNSFLKGCGYVPAKGKEGQQVRYRIYHHSLDLASNTGTGRVDPDDVAAASNDKMAIGFGDIEKVKAVLFPPHSADSKEAMECASGGCFPADPTRGRRDAAIGRLASLPHADALPVIIRLLEENNPEELRQVLSSYIRIDREAFMQYVLQKLRNPDQAAVESAINDLGCVWYTEENQSILVVNELLSLLKDPDGPLSREIIDLLRFVNDPNLQGGEIQMALEAVALDGRYPWQSRVCALESVKTLNQAALVELFFEGLGGRISVGEMLEHHFFRKYIVLLGGEKRLLQQNHGKQTYWVIFANDSGSWLERKCVKILSEKDSSSMSITEMDFDGLLPQLHHLNVCQGSGAVSQPLFASASNLQSLELGWSLRNPCEILGWALRHCPPIESLCIGGCISSAETLQTAFKDQLPLKHISSLFIADEVVTDHLVPLCPNLRKLSVPFVSGIGTKNLSSCSKITHLHFNQPHLSDEDLDSILGIQSLVDFSMFCLGQSRITGLKLSTSNPNLRRLMLGSCGAISHKGMENIAKLYPSLRHFQVYGENLEGTKKGTEKEEYIHRLKGLFHPDCTLDLDGFGDEMRKHCYW